MLYGMAIILAATSEHNNNTYYSYITLVTKCVTGRIEIGKYIDDGPYEFLRIKTAETCTHVYN